MLGAVSLLTAIVLLIPLAAQQPRASAQTKKKAIPPPIKPKAEELARVKEKTDRIEESMRAVKASGKMREAWPDVDVYAKAGRFLLEFPETFFTQEGVDRALTVLDQGIERARALQAGNAPWIGAKRRNIHGYYSDLDGSVQPYGVTVPESYDGSKPVRLYVWLHGRDQILSEASFLFRFPNPNTGITYKTADVGQITIDCYGRWNNANHWAGEVDVFEAIADVKKRYKIDPDRVILRGFSLGGAGAWHIALHHPDEFAAADIGAGTYPRRAYMPGFPPYQAGPLRIWENILDYSLNAFNIPIAAHDGDSDVGASGLPAVPGEKNRGQLESSLRVRAQLEKEGFASGGEPNFLRVKGTPSIFLISANTGHSVSPLVRQQVDAFLKENGDRGRVSPDHVRFVTFSTRYNRSFWVSVDGLDKHYERSDVDARRDAAREQFTISTKNIARLTLRETGKLKGLTIDGRALRVKAAPEIRLEKGANGWSTAKNSRGPRKTHALQGPIDDAFLDPYLLVRPTGVPWNQAAHDQAMRMLARFDRVYARWYRAHPRVKDDKDVTPEDFKRYHVALFGDPGSNRWIAKLAPKLPLRWNRESIAAGSKSFAAASHVPAFVYPNPMAPSKYVVINSGLTIDEREYQSDYSMPKLGDFAILKVGEGADVPDVAVAGLFDEFWRLPAEFK